MNNRIRFIVFLTLWGCFFVPTLLMGTSLEETYFEARNSFIRQFDNTTNSIDEDPALAELGDKLKIIVGPINVEGFSKQGKINLITLQKELGFGQVDGLRFNSPRETLFVTTNSILKKYLAENPSLPKDLANLSKTEEFYRYVFYVDAHVTYYAKIPVKSTKEKTFAYAFLGITAQDIGPFIPTEIFVLVSNGNRVKMVHSPVETEITEIPRCLNEWDEYDRKGSEAFKVYLASKLNNKKAINDFYRYEEQGFEAYHRCYEREAKNHHFFTLLKKQAQLIVDRLLKD